MAWSWFGAERLSLGGLLREAGRERSLPPEGAGLLGEVPGCPVLVPEAAYGLELTTGSGTWSWFCVESLSLGVLLREAGLVGRAHRLREQGYLGKTLAVLPCSEKLPLSGPASQAELHPAPATGGSRLLGEVPDCPVLVPEAAYGPELTTGSRTWSWFCAERLSLGGLLQEADRVGGNIFVVSLAIADLVVAIYPYPLVLTSIFNNGWNLGSLHCQISGFLMGLSVIGSIFNITGIAINRYCYICHSLKYDRLYSNKNSLCYVFLIWMLTLVAIVPNLRTETLQYDPRIYSCTFAQSVSSAYTIAVVVFHFILPMVIVIFCYLRIWILVLQVRRRVKSDNKPKLKPQDFRNFVTMFVVFVLFAICWAPLNFIGLIVATDPTSMVPRIPEWLFVTSYYMAYFNSCLNAIIYGLLNQNFRKEYRRIIVSLCTAKMFFVDSSNDVADKIKCKPSPLITNKNLIKVDSV
ncbi:Melatonin receptor type 1A [Sciurus carolinensis]|uniref:Melatonin receptor type 1A n=1 Tax=Sciurus carolinensis TaxID=30640 RepID=A0AA41MUW8_SCICA|nr:Melatonin receptor type 1A [Sciurus carolinensis]